MKNLILKVMIILGIVMLFNLITTPKQEIKWVEETYVIGQGETLWDIAEQYNENTDIRNYIYMIKDLNPNLNTGNLQVGQEIKILVKGGE